MKKKKGNVLTARTLSGFADDDSRDDMTSTPGTKNLGITWGKSVGKQFWHKTEIPSGAPDSVVGVSLRPLQRQ